MINQSERDDDLLSIRQQQPYTVVIDGLDLLVEKDVFPPDLGFTSQHLGKVLGDYQPHTALDMGCGVGYLAMLLKKNGVPEVWAVDNHKPAIKCTLKNIKRNKLQPIKVARSDLFLQIPKSVKFDLIVFNQPYYPATEEVIFGLGFDGGKEIVVRFLEQTKDYLTDKGVIIMPFSDIAGKENDPKIIAEKLGWLVKVIYRTSSEGMEHRIYEMLQQ